MNYRFSFPLAAAAAAIMLCSCGSESIVTVDTVEKLPVTGENWTIMVYMCGGSDEHNSGMASQALMEMSRVKYPENINVVVETGGTYEWDAEGIDTNYLDRFEAQDGGLRLIERVEQQSMAKSETLTDFLKWSKNNYESENYALIVCGNGANSAYGMLYDETAEDECMNLQRLSLSIQRANMQLSILGFDADISASIENAAVISDFTDYMVASQERMGNCGWNYEDWLNFIIDNPTASVLDIAIAACDTYMDKCERLGTDEMASMSVTDLSAVTSLSQALEGMSGELNATLDDLSKYAELSSNLNKIMPFGACSPEEGYSNMVDLNDLAIKSSSITDRTSGRVQEEISKAVLYRANGVFRQDACGLSIYYPLKKSEKEVSAYAELSPLKRYREFVLGICPGEDVKNGANGTVSYKDFENDKEWIRYNTIAGTTGLELNMTCNMDTIDGISQRIYKKDENGYMYIGSTDDIDSNIDAGIFKTKNEFTFPVVNGHNLSLRTVFNGNGYTIYTAPVKLDGKFKNLRIARYYDSNKHVKYKCLGMFDSISENGRTSRLVDKVHIYNLLTPMYREYSTGTLADGKSFKTWPIGMNIKNASLADGEYRTDYSVRYVYGDSFVSGSADFSVQDGVINYN